MPFVEVAGVEPALNSLHLKELQQSEYCFEYY